MSRRLHYIFDPLCGWCYGASRLVDAAATTDGLSVQLHGGGLWPQPTKLPAEARGFIRDADNRVGAMNGVPYGDAYLDGLILDPELTLESRPTTTAILAAESCKPGLGLQMLHAIQSAHFVDGRHVVRRDVLNDLATGLGLDAGEFDDAWNSIQVEEHIAETRTLMEKIGASGFPAFMLEIDDQWYAVPHHQFAGNPTGFSDWLLNAGSN